MRYKVRGGQFSIEYVSINQLHMLVDNQRRMPTEEGHHSSSYPFHYQITSVYKSMCSDLTTISCLHKRIMQNMLANVLLSIFL